MSGGNTILSALGNMFPWGGRRTVKMFLRDSTQESILKDLLEALKRRTFAGKTFDAKRFADLEKVFESHAVEDHDTKRPYWNEESFADYVKQTHPNLASSQAATQLLWRVFYFHAFHPFSHTTADGKIDQEDFQRAILILAARGADLLGVLEEADMYWQFGYDQNLVHQAKLKRILRSIAVPEPATTLTENESNFVVAESADVVGMAQPFFMPDAPLPDEVFPAARRLVSGNPVQSRHRVARKDLAGLLGILIRLRLHASAPLGSFEKAGSDDDLESTLLDSLWGQDQEYQEFDQVTSILYQLPNLYIQFSQIWEVLFQPPVADVEVQSQVPDGISNGILNVTSLLVPHPIIGANGPAEGEDRRIALDPIQLSPNGQTATAQDITKALTSDTRPHVVLLTGKDTKTSQSTTIGAYIPSPSRGASMCAVFEIQPRFLLHRWTSSSKGLAETLITQGSASPDPASGQPLRIRQVDSGGDGIEVNPAKSLASLVCHSTTIEIEYGLCSVLGVSGGEPAVLPGLENTRLDMTKALPGIVSGESAPQVAGEALKGRIMGFGPG